MNVTATPAPKSSVLLEVELPADRLDRAVGQAVQRLGRRTRVPGFRPGKAPRPVLERVLAPGAVLEDAVDHLVADAYRDALLEKQILPLTDPNVEVVQAEEGKPLIFKATVPVRPEVRLGDYQGFPFGPEIEVTDDAKVDQVIDELRDQQATLAPAEDRPARKGDYAVVGYVGTRDGEPFDGGSAERVPLILGDERLIPGFEEHVVGLRPGESTDFDITFPEDYGEASLAGQEARFHLELKELRDKVLPDLDDDFARSMGQFATMAELRSEVRKRLERNALDRARHGFADRIIDYAVANATLEMPDILIDQEVEVMHDEFRSTLTRQGITEEAYRKASEKTDADLHADFRPQAEQRVKVLLVLSRIAEAEGVEIPEADVEAEVQRARARYPNQPRLVRYFESERGRNFIRSTLRRSRLVEILIDRWLAAHPEHPPLPHLEDDDSGAIEAQSAQSSAAVGATDPGSIEAQHGHDHDAGHAAEVVPADDATASHDHDSAAERADALAGDRG